MVWRNGGCTGKSGKVWICVSLKPLNRSVRREVHPLPKVDETLAQLARAKVFLKLDANSGFWQTPLSQPSHLLTTFITPIGCYCFNKLPFGILSAPEHFKCRTSEILAGLEGVLRQMDVLIFGKDPTKHDQWLKAALQRIEKAGATLNPQKCEFQTQVGDKAQHWHWNSLLTKCIVSWKLTFSKKRLFTMGIAMSVSKRHATITMPRAHGVCVQNLDLSLPAHHTSLIVFHNTISAQ